METFEDKKVPFIADYLEEIPNLEQENLCEMAECENEEIDCGECLFSTKFCDRILFEHWKAQQIEQNGQ